MICGPALMATGARASTCSPASIKASSAWASITSTSFIPTAPIEETMGALHQAVRSGKALYAGISNYNAEQTAAAAAVLRRLGTPCLIHQFKYSMFQRWSEMGLLERLRAES